MQKQRKPRYDSFQVGLVSYRVWTRGSFGARGGWWIRHVTLWVSNWTKPLSVTKYLKKKQGKANGWPKYGKDQVKRFRKVQGSLIVMKWKTKTNTQREGIIKELRACHLMFSVFPLSSLRVKHVLNRTKTNKTGKKYLKYTRRKSH